MGKNRPSYQCWVRNQGVSVEGARSRRFLGGVGVGIQTMLGVEVGVEMFCPTPEVQLIYFFITLLSWEFLLKWYNSV